ncbi:hypothetical protein [Amycolatopsis sp. H20-H5]|uniref:hypothetical protein n=1 Tax=Amycolatopsis sp. H20-H5 TaxID=3046309 RepID=UPI002DBD6DBC|nr:hypothetical protein [Amycolatopsis sp. H20-H5]MEC3974941.1 hypothetical protein [Amycolatopsis sp. H20-H5]
MITNAANRIAARMPQLTLDQLEQVVLVAIECLDEEAGEEIGLGGDYTGPAVTGLNTLAEMLGVPGVTPADDLVEL